MSTKEARTRATRAWRERKQEKLIQAYLHTDIVSRLDALVQERGATGRAAVLADLIESACTPKPDKPALAPKHKPEPKNERAWKPRKSTRPGWHWDIVVDGEVTGWMRRPELPGGQWSGETASSPGAVNRRYGRTRDELGDKLASMYRVSRE